MRSLQCQLLPDPRGRLYTPKSKAPHRGPVLGRGACLSSWPWELRVTFGPSAHGLSPPAPLEPMADTPLPGCVGLAQAGHAHGSQLTAPSPAGRLASQSVGCPFVQEGVCPSGSRAKLLLPQRGPASPRFHATSPARSWPSPAAARWSSLVPCVLRDPSLSETHCALPRTRSAFLIVLLESDLLSTEPLSQDEFALQG